MPLPFVIDNRTVRLDEVLNEILGRHQGRSVDVATAYFSIRGFERVREGLDGLGSFRLILGANPQSGEDIGIHLDPRASQLRLQDAGLSGGVPDAEILRHELARAPLTEGTQRLIEDLIRFLRKDTVAVRRYANGFLHAKSWLFYGDRGAGAAPQRITPVLGIVGSSNFTGPGLMANNELNLVHRVLLEEDLDDPAACAMLEPLLPGVPPPDLAPMQRRAIKSEVGARAIAQLVDWYDEVWAESEDCKDALIEVLAASKYGEVEYTPFDIYLKALYHYFADEAEDEPPDRATAVDLAEFQEDAVNRARRILARHAGVMVADSVGLGKTWIGKRLLEDYGYFQRQKVLVVCPASLRSMWEGELREASIAGAIVTHEWLGRPEATPLDYGGCDVILIDESHNFRNHRAMRYEAIEQLIAAGGGRGEAGERKKVILLTATPINNDLFDLYNQISLITQRDDGYFAAAQIGDLRKYFLAARRDDSPDNLFNLLEEVVVRRPRSHIRENYPDATIRGEPIRWPDRRLITERYSLAQVYGDDFYQDIVTQIEHLHLSPYRLDDYRRSSASDADAMERGRQQALVGIFKSLYLKRFESSVHAFRMSVETTTAFLQEYKRQLREGRVLTSKGFRRLRVLEQLREDDEGTAQVEDVLAGLEQVDPAAYDIDAILAHVDEDLQVLARISGAVSHIKPSRDAKLQALLDLLRGELKGQKVLLFSYFRDTARYLYNRIREDARLLTELGEPNIRCVDSDVLPRDRDVIVERFAPVASGKPALKGSAQEIDILIATDALSEGKNLQDCQMMINYDLHWAPVRMIQRAGRIDRIGTPFDELFIRNFYPDKELDDLLGLVASLEQKLEAIDAQGLHDASVLGEIVHPRAFNTIRRIGEEDSSVIEEEEASMELASAEGLRAQLRQALEGGYGDRVASLPDGIHSCRERAGERGIFFHFQAFPDDPERRRHYWVYRDHATGRFEDNRFRIAQLIACGEGEPRAEPIDSVFDVLADAVEHVLGSIRRTAAMEQATPKADPEQVKARAALKEGARRGAIDRERSKQVMRFLAQPMMAFARRRVREAMEEHGSADPEGLLDALDELRISFEGQTAPMPGQPSGPVTADDLLLVCFEYVR